MRTRLVLIAVLLQVLLLGFMAGEREWILRFGRQLLLRSAPLDPNDPMRGYYARFTYDISNVPSSLWRDGLPARLNVSPGHYADSRRIRDLRVYARLRLDDSGIATLESLSDVAPVGGPYLRGRVNSVNNQRSVNVRYGIEALFMQQGESLKLEEARRRERPGAPMDAEIAVSSYGVAVLQGYRWEPLGLVATFERANFPPPAVTAPPPAAGNPTPGRPQSPPPRPQQRQGQFVAAVQLELKNYGPETVAIVDLPDGGSFRLVPNERGQEIRYRWVGENRPVAPPADGRVIVLKPGESHVTKIDLTQPQWFVTDLKAKPEQQQPLPLRDVTEVWSASFRVEYSPPDKAAAVGLPHAELIRHTPVRSRAFNPSAGVD